MQVSHLFWFLSRSGNFFLQPGQHLSFHLAWTGSDDGCWGWETMDFWKRVYGCCSATSYLVFVHFFFLVQYFGCWWHLSPTAKIIEDVLEVGGFGGFSARLLHTQVVYCAWQCLCPVFHGILLATSWNLQASMGLTWLRHLLPAMTATHHCCLFPACFPCFWDQPHCLAQAQGPAGHF